MNEEFWEKREKREKEEKDAKALTHAVKEGNIDVLEYLIESGADLNAMDMSGRTVLIYAAKEGTIDVIKYLIESGADVNVQDGSRRTALHEAANEHKVTAIKALIEAGADLNAKDRDGKTALHYACPNDIATTVYIGEIEKNRETIRLLIKAGADLNAKDRDGKTALHSVAHGVTRTRWVLERLCKENPTAAVSVEYKEKHSIFLSIIQLLMEAGANVNARDNLGEKPLHKAKSYKEAIALLSGVDNSTDTSISRNVETTPKDKLGWISKAIFGKA